MSFGQDGDGVSGQNILEQSLIDEKASEFKT